MSFLDMKWYEICAEKSTENPMHIMRLIIEMESRLTSHNVMNPTTPTSIETIENATQSEQILLGISSSETMNIMTAATLTHCTVVGNTIKNWSKQGNLLKGIENKTVKGQLISKCLFCFIVWTKIPTKKFPGFLP